MKLIPRKALYHSTSAVFMLCLITGLSIGLFAPLLYATPAYEFAYQNVFAPVNGAVPYAPMVVGDLGVLYGTTLFGGIGSASSTTGNGVLFRVNPDGTGFMVLHYFGANSNDGYYGIVSPSWYWGTGGLMIGQDRRLYGVTSHGGTNGQGTLFSVRQDGTDYRILYNFGPDGVGVGIWPTSTLTQGRDGTLYGKTLGEQCVYKIQPDGSGHTVLHAFRRPIGNGCVIMGSDDVLYGISDSDAGTLARIFRMDLDGNNFTNLYAFTAANDGLRPFCKLLETANGTLFGTASSGGTATNGVIFKINKDGSGFQVVHNFADGSTANDQGQPYSGLVTGPGGMLYGTTIKGGSVYQIGADGLNYSLLYVGGDALRAYGGLCVGASAGSAGVLFGSSVEFGNIFGIVLSPSATITPLIGSSPNGMAVFWPAWAQGFRLQTKTNLAATWVDVTNSVPVIGVQVPGSSSNSFFRLVAP